MLRQLDAEIRDATTAARGTAPPTKKAAIAAAKAHDGAKRLRSRRPRLEPRQFITRIEEIAGRGAPTADAGSAGRDVDAPFVLDLDDGVMINGAARFGHCSRRSWNDPKRWWKQLCAPSGKKDYDWAHLAKRYFPTRVEAKCAEDPEPRRRARVLSLAAAPREGLRVGAPLAGPRSGPTSTDRRGGLGQAERKQLSSGTTSDDGGGAARQRTSATQASRSEKRGGRRKEDVQGDRIGRGRGRYQQRATSRWHNWPVNRSPRTARAKPSSTR